MMPYRWNMADDARVEGRLDARTRIVEVAARLLQEQGPAAGTTRGVAQGAGVQAPMIYRLFGDKDGLLDAVAEHVLAAYSSATAVSLGAERFITNNRRDFPESIKEIAVTYPEMLPVG